MKLTTRARYALRMMLELARHEPNVAVSLGDVAKRTDISRRYLDQLAVAMKTAGLLVSRSGRGGGYALSRPAAEIHLGVIIEAAIGPINIVDCVLKPEGCLKADLCECRSIYAVINRRIAQVFAAFSLADVTDPAVLARLTAELEPGPSVHAGSSVPADPQ